MAIGLENIATTQSNKITVKISSNRLIKEYLKNKELKESLFSFIFKQLKFEFNFDSDKKFFEKFYNFIRNLLEEKIAIPELSPIVLQLSQKLKELSIKAKIKSTAVLEDEKRSVFFDWLLNLKQIITINKTNEKPYILSMNYIQPDVEFFFAVPELGVNKGIIKLEGFLDFFKYYVLPE